MMKILWLSILLAILVSVKATAQPCNGQVIASYQGSACVGRPIMLTASNVPGASYSWTGPNGFTSSLQNPTTTTPSVMFGAEFIVTANTGSCIYKDTVDFSVYPTPYTPYFFVTTLDLTLIQPPYCAGSSIGVVFPASAVEMQYYLWTPLGTIDTSGGYYYINTLTPAYAGLYKAVCMSTAGCYSDTGYYYLNVTSIDTPFVYITVDGKIKASGTVLKFSSHVAIDTSDVTYQWYRNGQEINGATQSSYTVTIGIDAAYNDSFFVKAIHDSLCTSEAVSNKIFLNESLGVQNINRSVATLYPNPNAGHFHVKAKAKAGETMRIEVSNLAGQILFTDNTTAISPVFEKEYMLQDIANGMYLLRICNSRETVYTNLFINR